METNNQRTITRRRRIRDPNRPKRGLTAYMLFNVEQRKILRKENKELPFKELIKIVTERWKNLSETEKKPYYSMANQDKIRYEKEMEEYLKTQNKK
ncbi:high mobility group protein [Anaeramoeba flamelloides]|uniref:High mobility group protein n=1 Tax=Anaeramoeba flamelloides TaxID=1746091 RepID=A0AAV7ZRU4_9EUKA|nr:high mobility group protein [Anaeramoeba flamelloides]